MRIRHPFRPALVGTLLALAALAPLTVTAATFNVTNGNDSGSGSLRNAILAANADATGTIQNPHIITFASGVSQVTVASPLPALNRPTLVNVFGSRVTIRATSLIFGDGFTLGPAAAGSVVQNFAVVCSNPVPCFTGSGIRADGQLTETLIDLALVDGVGQSGIQITGASRIRIDRATLIRNAQTAGNSGGGIHCQGSGASDIGFLHVTRSRIGIDGNGNSAGNLGHGVRSVHCLARIGGPADTEGNVISANAHSGVLLDRSSSSRVEGNLIGLDANGVAARGNDGGGVHITRSTSVIVGGDDDARGNAIAGNGNTNIRVFAAEPSDNARAQIRRNWIGTRRNGTPLAPGANRASTGIQIHGWAEATIGTGAHGNLIRDHSFAGIEAASAGEAGKMRVSRNSIFANGAAIVDAGNRPVPQLNPIGGTSLISGTVPGGASGGLVEFYVDDWNQSRIYVGEVDHLSPNGAGGADFATLIDLTPHTGKRLTALYREPPSIPTSITRTGALAAPVPIGARILSVSLVGRTGAERVDSNPTAIDCPGYCSAGFASGTVILTAYPGANRRVTWSGDCTGSGTCSVSMNQNRNVTATFGPALRRLTVDRDGPGTVSSNPAGIACGATCAHDFNHGQTIALTATPAADHRFDGWTGACSGPAGCSVAMTADRTVGARFSRIQRSLVVTRSGLGTVVSTPAGIDCGATCTASFGQGTSVALDATPAAGWQFSHWQNCPGASGPRCNLVVPATDSGIQAVFTTLPPSTQPLSVTRVGSGNVTSSPPGINCGATCSAAFTEGSTVQLTAAPAFGWTFAGWSGACTGTGTCTVTMSQPRSVVATFAPPTRLLTVSRTGEGTLRSAPTGIDCGTTCTHAFELGTVVTLEAIPAAGWQFDGYTGDHCSGLACTVTMDDARAVGAVFSPVPGPSRTLTVTRNGSGTVTSTPDGIACGSTCQATFANGTAVSLLATPAAGWQFIGWGGACEGSGACQVVMGADRAVSATFAVIPPTTHPLTVNRHGDGFVSSTPSGIGCGDECQASFPAGTQVTLTATPPEGSTFAGWHGACTGHAPCTVTMSEPRVVGARFVVDRIFVGDFE
jgi:hypothetical protein